MTLRRRADSIATAHLWLWSSDMNLLDTNVVSELRRPDHMAPSSIGSGRRRQSNFSCPPLRLERYRRESRITREQDDAKAEELEVWLDKVLASYGVLPMDAPRF